MNDVLAVIFLSGPLCASPADLGPSTVEVYRVPCATVIRGISANPYKIVQTENIISVGHPSHPKKKRRHRR